MSIPTQNPTRWQTFSSAPHRMYFFAGTVSLLLATVLWLADYAALFLAGHPLLVANANDLYAHGVIMSLGVFPLFISGFILTTFPRWMSLPAVPRTRYAAAAVLQTGGLWLVLLGLLLGNGWIRIGLFVDALGWLIVLLTLAGVFLKASERPIHAWIILPAFTAGFSLTLFLALQPSPLQGSWPKIPQLAIWWVLLPIFLNVAHRMIPFFSKNVIPGYHMQRPTWLLWGMMGLILIRPLLGSPGGIALGLDFALFLGALYLWLLWKPWQALHNRLLLVLHLGFAWLWIALLLWSINDLCYLLSVTPLLWMAPLHTLTLGFFGSLLLAMATRVSLGHSGRPLQLPYWGWLMFVVIQLATVLRIVAGFPGIKADLAIWIVALSGTLWLAAFLLWALRFMPIYWQRRVDHQPG